MAGHDRHHQCGPRVLLAGGANCGRKIPGFMAPVKSRLFMLKRHPKYHIFQLIIQSFCYSNDPYKMSSRIQLPNSSSSPPDHSGAVATLGSLELRFGRGEFRGAAAAVACRGRCLGGSGAMGCCHWATRWGWVRYV